MVPTGRQMAQALDAMIGVLVGSHLVTSWPQGLGLATADLRKAGASTKWSYAISPASPVEFAPYHSRDLNKDLFPRVYGKVAVNPALVDANLPPFEELNTAIEIYDPEQDCVMFRCHVDLAERQGRTYQDAPLFHIQYGGQSTAPYALQLEPIREPRLSYFPMDVLMMCEAVVAACHMPAVQGIWQDPALLEPLKISERMCLSKYFELMSDYAARENFGILRSMWAPWCARHPM